MQKEKTLIKGIVSLLILDILMNGELHGYAIRKKLLEQIDEPIPSGYIYVILKHLESKKYIVSTVKKSKNRTIKVYSITEDGRSLLFDHKAYLNKMISIAEKILSDLERHV